MPVVPVPDALAVIRELIADGSSLVRAVAAGRRRTMTTRWRRVELRPVLVRGELVLQSTAYDERQAHTTNHGYPDAALAEADIHLGDGYAHWHVDTLTETIALRITKKGAAILHRAARVEPTPAAEDPARLAHDRVKPRLLPQDSPVWRSVGVTDGLGRIKPTKRDKHRQVEDFLRLLAPTIDDAIAAGHLARPTAQRPLRLVDLGCGNAYLTLAAYAYLTDVAGLPVNVVGVDVSAPARDRNIRLVRELGWQDSVTFVAGTIAGANLADVWPSVDRDNPQRVDVVLALHACDTATDDALAWGTAHHAPVILAAPCCHHDIQRQLREGTASPAGWSSALRHGILRERLGDVITDSLRAQLLRIAGHRVDVVEFVATEHTPRNVMIRAVFTGAAARAEDVAEYRALTSAWGVTPVLAQALAPTES